MLLSLPIGSGQIERLLGLVERYAKMFNIHNEPHPSLLANSMHLRVVGLSYCSVAVEGFKPMKVALGSFLFQVLIR